MLKVIPRDYFDDQKGTLKLLWEEEWRALGITQVGEKNQAKPDLTIDWIPEFGLGTLRGP